jgi:hypothetical protein
MADEQKQPEVKEATAAQKPAPAAELTVQDLSAIKQIIDVASTRGAFRASEMAVVGNTYNKLESFLSAVSAQQEPKEDPKGE